MSFEKNIELLYETVANDGAIFPFANHRLEDGSANVPGNLKVWDKAAEPFEKVYLWEEGAPGFSKEKSPLQDQPYLMVVPQKEEGSERGTIIVAHGGGFSWRTGCEGFNVAEYFHKAGYHVAILSYRLVPYTRFDAIDDMKRAIRLIKAHHEEWGVSDKIVLMGFSAGAMLSGNCATHMDEARPECQDPIERLDTKVEAAVIGYGAFSFITGPKPFGPMRNNPLDGKTIEERFYLALEKNVTPKTPPMFIWQTRSDDGRHGMTLARALEEADVPYELHIFNEGVHGLAMADGHNDLGMDVPAVHIWGQMCDSWLKAMGL